MRGICARWHGSMSPSIAQQQGKCTLQVLLNMLKAHAAAYKAMKAVPGCADIQIGFVHHHVEFMPVNPKHWWIKPLAWWGTFWWGRDTVLHFLQTGEFEWHVPLWGRSAHLPLQSIQSIQEYCVVRRAADCSPVARAHVA